MSVRAQRFVGTAFACRTQFLVAVIARTTIARLIVTAKLLRNALRRANASELLARTRGRLPEAFGAQGVRFVRTIGTVVAAVAGVGGRDAGGIVRAHEILGEFAEAAQTFDDDAICTVFDVVGEGLYILLRVSISVVRCSLMHLFVVAEALQGAWMVSLPATSVVASNRPSSYTDTEFYNATMTSCWTTG